MAKTHGLSVVAMSSGRSSRSSKLIEPSVPVSEIIRQRMELRQTGMTPSRESLFAANVYQQDEFLGAKRDHHQGSRVRKLHQADTTLNAPPEKSLPPCFNHPRCRNRAMTEKAGRSLCRSCANSVKGREYPLRQPSFLAIYASGFDCAHATDMIEMKFAEATMASFKHYDSEHNHTEKKGGEADAPSSQHLQRDRRGRP